MKDNESAKDTSAVCLKLFQEMGVEFAIPNIDNGASSPDKISKNRIKAYNL